jgi:hypothetical protein
MEHNRRVASDEALASTSQKLAKVCAMLKPFQSFDFDPGTGIVKIMTELRVLNAERDKFSAILAQRRADEQLAVKCFTDHYRVILTRSIRL